jgi:hypothetical protein
MAAVIGLGEASHSFAHFAAIIVAISSLATPLCAQVNISVNTSAVIAEMPADAIGLHTSVYANIFNHPAYPQAIAEGGIQTLRYPGGNYASIYHWSNHVAHDGYAAPASHFGNFVDRLLDGSGANAMVTVNYGASLQNNMGGQPKEAAAWVAYANGDASLYNTPNDIVIGVDAAGNDWRTVGYWARLRGLTAAQNPDNQYDRLAIDHDAPIGIKYWEIGNEVNGNGYYTDFDINWGWQNDRHVGYENPVDTNPSNPNEPLYYPSRANNTALSPTAYANNFNAFVTEMKRVDPTIQIGAVLAGPGGVGDVADPARNWDANVLPIAGPNMDFGIYHWYPGGSNNQNTNTNQVLGATDDLPGTLQTIRNRLNTYVEPGAADDIPIHMTEFGYFGAAMSQTNNGVFAANTYATALAAGVNSAHWLELSSDTYLGDNATDTNGDGVPDVPPTKGGAYYGIQVFSRIAQPDSAFVQTSSSSGNLEAHSLLLPDGRVGLLLANLNSSGSSTVDVSIDDAALIASGTTWLYGQGLTTPLETVRSSGLGNAFSISVPARSIMAVLIDAAPSMPGDFNHDGEVDAADYIVWRKGGLDAGAAYDIWRTRFGETGRGEVEFVTVPEPGNVLALAIGMLSAVAWQRADVLAQCGAFHIICAEISRQT